MSRIRSSTTATIARPRNRRTALAAAAIGILGVSGGAMADLIEFVPTPEGGFVQVNGTEGADLIAMGNLCDGSILVLRLSGWTLTAGTIDAASAAMFPVVVLAGGGHDVIDTSAVTSVGLEIDAGAGNDVVFAGPMSDLIRGGAGDDIVYGGDGPDFIFGGPGFRDQLFGEAGDDNISDEDGVLAARGGSGNDSISILFSTAWDNNSNPLDLRKAINQISGGAGDDFITIGNPGTPIQFTINGDVVGSTTDTGIDFVDIFGDVDAASTFPNVEFVTYFLFSEY